MERTVDFFRPRHMLCGRCNRHWTVDLEWLERWDEGKEHCPGCGVTSAAREGASVTVDPANPALIDKNVTLMAWYHTTTHDDWPSENFDPTSDWTDLAWERMNSPVGQVGLRDWIESQQSKALHVGTYEAAIHNMLRRIRDQADEARQFYLYRVRLRPNVSVREGWLREPGDFVGDTPLPEICPPGADVTRYLNEHEDPGGISLALGRTAIEWTRRIAVPPVSGRPRPRVESSSEDSDSITGSLAELIPVNLRSEFAVATQYRESAGPVSRDERAYALAAMIIDPDSVLGALDREPERHVAE